MENKNSRISPVHTCVPGRAAGLRKLFDHIVFGRLHGLWPAKKRFGEKKGMDVGLGTDTFNMKAECYRDVMHSVCTQCMCTHFLMHDCPILFHRKSQMVRLVFPMCCWSPGPEGN